MKHLVLAALKATRHFGTFRVDLRGLADIVDCTMQVPLLASDRHHLKHNCTFTVRTPDQACYESRQWPCIAYCAALLTWTI